MAILLRPFQFLAHQLWLYCLDTFSFLLADYDYIALALSVSCSPNMAILSRPSVLLPAGYDYIVYALSVSCSSIMTILFRPL
jgi:hypothetical protein